ncbi:LOW QUALITY PROTEIN: protein FAM217A [Camelus ferus]|uniref:LOW QUALITY PROTEIN: protein FAM217A n=1 Tax=Camelus ferus TaxID=419612 RepID=A0A8B8RKF4_CAMFR|nr:LOW QUALITY PROTEIN: protein FAM217A [Camelus ferus]
MRWEGPTLPKEDSSCSSPGAGKPVKSEALRAERPGPRGGSARGDAAGDQPGASGAERTARKQRSKMGRRNGDSSGTSLRAARSSGENLSHWNLDAEVPVPENKNLLPGRDSAVGGKVNKNGKQGVFQLRSFPLDGRSIAEDRDFRRSSMETGYHVTSSPTMLLAESHSRAAALVGQRVSACPGLGAPAGLCWPHADGDFCKDRNEPQVNLCSAVENNSGDILTTPTWDLKCGRSSVEEGSTDESDLPGNERANEALLSYFKKMGLSLKPETIESVDDFFTEEPSAAFPYPDLLPPPFGALDLHRLAFSRSANWTMTAALPESSLEPLITLLLEMERLQHVTIQKERPRLQTPRCTPGAPERPSSSKPVPKTRQPRLSDSLSLQTTCADKSHEKSKSDPGSCKLECSTSRWTGWSSAGRYRWGSRPSLKSSSTTKQVTATYDDSKNPRSATLNPGQELSAKPAPARAAQLLVKMVPTRCLPPKSPIPVAPISLSFPENEREGAKVPRTQKKLYRKNVVLNKPFCAQKLNCLSSSLIEKDKCSPIDQK